MPTPPDSRFQASEHYWHNKASLFASLYQTWNPLLFSARLFLEQRQQIVRRLILTQQRRDTALDVGCGSGEFAEQLSEHFGRVVGADYSVAMLELAKSRCRTPKIEFIRSDCAHLPLEPASVDFVSALGLLDYVADVDAAVREFHRVLRPAGQAILTLPKSPSLFAPLRWSQGFRSLMFKLPPILNIYSRAEVENLLARNGFELLEAIPLWTTMWILHVRVKPAV